MTTKQPRNYVLADHIERLRLSPEAQSTAASLEADGFDSALFYAALEGELKRLVADNARTELAEFESLLASAAIAATVARLKAN